MSFAARDFANAAIVAAAVARASRQLRPPPNLKPSQWAEQNVKIPVGNAIPGLIRFDNAPYQREPLDLTADPSCHQITLQWGAQVGKTLLALCAQGYRIGQNPTSQIMMQPSQGDLQTWLETKFNPLIDANEDLRSTIAKPRGRDGINNQRMKSYPGGFIMFSWAGSPKTMRGRSAPFIVCDEVDGYDRTAEGHPVSLLWQRAATFEDDKKLITISTPTIKGVSFIENAFEQGDQRRFHVACPHCGTHQPLKWAGVKWDRDEAGEDLPLTARYVCQAHDPETGEVTCGRAWSDGERVAAIRNAEKMGAGWKAAKPFRGHASFHLSELYSCFRKLSSIVQSFLEKKAANDLQTFVNVSLAETWEEHGDQNDASELMARAEEYAAPVPQGGAVLTAGIDMQEDRLEVETVAWGLGEESWSIDYKVLWGDPLRDEVWEDLDDYLSQTFLHQSGAQLGISAAALDTGGNSGYTQAAYEYVRKRRGHRLFAVKGGGNWGSPVVSSPSRKRSGRRARKVDLFTVGSNEAKLIVMRRFALTTTGPGYCHFPRDRDPEWFDQATAERLVVKHIKGVPYREWYQTRPRNEALDCRVYAYAALKIINPDIPAAVRRLGVLEPPRDDIPDEPENTARPKRMPPRPSTAPKNPPEEPNAAEPQSKPKRSARSRPRRRISGWVNGWG